MHSWSMHRAMTDVLKDVAVNILAYIPLGLFGFFMLMDSSPAAAAALTSVLIGFGLSFFVEVTQCLVPGRNPNGLDLTSNTIGAAAGVALALLWVRVPHPHSKRPDSICLIACWVCAVVFAAIAAWSRPGRPARWRPVDTLQDFAATLAVAVLVNSLGGSSTRRRLVLAALVLIVGVRAAVVPRSSTIEGLAGVAVAFGIVLVAQPRPGIAAVILAVAVTLHGLAPFTFVATAKPFSWLPFRASLMSDAEGGLAVLLGKIYLYGALIWLMRESRFRLVTATVAVATLLAAIEIAQLRLPGPTPEITDPLVALILGWVLWSLREVSAIGKNAPAKFRS